MAIELQNGTAIKVWPGDSYPLGATYDGAGTNFSIFSEVATAVQLCLFDDAGNEERINLTEVTGYCWHGYLPHIQPGQRYGYRILGPWDPGAGIRCNPAKLLMDPYAKAYEGNINWDKAVFPYDFKKGPLIIETTDSAPFMPRSVVHQPYFDWAGDRLLNRPTHESVIYEVHVKGFTALHPDIPEDLRGTYAGMAHPAAINYLKALGVTAVELMPVHQFVHDNHLIEQGLRNYWGYNSIGFMAPHNEYTADKRPGGCVSEFKQLVKTLHQANIEVILDVVYNHTAEGNHMGPMLGFKGIDNAYYYRVMGDQPEYYMDYTGTGNSLNVRNPHVLQLIMDSLRYWVTEMHVDGFRFDLAAALARELHDVNKLSAFFDLIQQDPVISQVKLIAEPWDVGEGGYQVGNFPPVWSEWNGKYRDNVRDFWRGEENTLGEFADRFTGSADLYRNNTRRPFASINFITAHDGFPLHDMVSYNDKHNDANGEGNRDGTDDNRSWNCGVEGTTVDPAVLKLRAKQKRNLLTTLLLSQGIPMLLGGDEIGRTQQGNNNAYCQDNEISWYDWSNTDAELLDFTQRLIAFRQKHPIFRRRGWFQGRVAKKSDVHDIAWFTNEAQPMTDDDWNYCKTLGIFLNGKTIPNPNAKADPVTDSSFYLMLNGHFEPVEFKLPPKNYGTKWMLELNTAEGWIESTDIYPSGRKVSVLPRSLMVFCHVE